MNAGLAGTAARQLSLSIHDGNENPYWLAPWIKEPSAWSFQINRTKFKFYLDKYLSFESN
jgi:hypothetical protein